MNKFTARLSSVDLVNRTAPLRIGDVVAKFGKATGFTVGTVHAPFDIVCMPDSGGKETREYSVLGDKGTAFAAGGDSGAFVLDGDGSLVGIVFGGNTATLLTYVIPIDAIFKDIEACTGCPVEL